MYAKIYQTVTIFISSDVTICHSSVAMFFLPIRLSLHFFFIQNCVFWVSIQAFLCGNMKFGLLPFKIQSLWQPSSIGWPQITGHLFHSLSVPVPKIVTRDWIITNSPKARNRGHYQNHLTSFIFPAQSWLLNSILDPLKT